MKQGTKKRKQGIKQGTDLAWRMAANEEFYRKTLQGWEDYKAGRVVSLEEVKRRLGDSITIVGVLAHSCNLYRK